MHAEILPFILTELKRAFNPPISKHVVMIIGKRVSKSLSITPAFTLCHSYTSTVLRLTPVKVDIPTVHTLLNTYRKMAHVLL